MSYVLGIFVKQVFIHRHAGPSHFSITLGLRCHASRGETNKHQIKVIFPRQQPSLRAFLRAKSLARFSSFYTWTIFHCTSQVANGSGLQTSDYIVDEIQQCSDWLEYRSPGENTCNRMVTTSTNKSKQRRHDLKKKQLNITLNDRNCS